MTARRIVRCGALALIAPLFIVACGSSASNSTSASSGAGLATTTSSDGASSENVASPAAEGTGLETPQPKQNGGPAIAVASLPIGGNVDVDGAQQCAHVNWLGPQPIPDGIVISLDGVGLDPAGVFRFGGSLCSADRPVCTPAWSWTPSTADVECLIPVTQVVDSGSPVALLLAGTVHCASESACRQFVNALGNQQIHFDAKPGVVTGHSASSATTTSSTSASSSDESSSANSQASSGASESTAGG
jgi:hypothetical protein